jgi:tetratricopeptide (TPR) repeat protein
MYRAYLGARDAKANKELWKNIVQSCQHVSDKNPQNMNDRYRLGLAQFGLLSSTMSTKDEDLFDDYVDQAESNLEKIKTGRSAEAKAILSAVYGLQLGYSPWKGMFLGPKSGSLMAKALKENPTSPLIWKLYANSKFHTPESFGGDIKEAITAYEKAVKLYEEDPAGIKNNWFYIDTMAFLGQAFMKTGETSKAVDVYEKALAFEPEFSWVKYSLLPAAKKKQQ